MVNSMTLPPKATENESVPERCGFDLASRYADQLVSSLRCFDRVIVHGTLVDVAHPGALLVSMKAAGFRPRDLPRFAEPMKEEIRDAAVMLAREHGVEIEVVTRKNFRQEDRVAAILKQRGTQPGLVHIFSVKETANVFDTRNARPDGYAKIIIRRGHCTHYYFYWIHPELGLIHVRVPTWLPCRVQIYFNGHSRLARQLDAAGISYEMADNAFAQCADWGRAQALADGLDPKDLHGWFDELARICCPPVKRFLNGYHWCLTQAEYAQDLVFKDPAKVDEIFEELARQALLVVKADDVARFLGKRLASAQDQQVNSHLGRRYAGLRLKHSLGPASVKLYNRPGGILRLEVTTYDVSFFRHYRQVVHRDGSKENKLTGMKKSIYSLRDLAGLMQAGVKRYSEWLATLVEHSAPRQDISKLGLPRHDEQGRSYRGFNPLVEAEARILEAVLRGEYALGGLTARRLHWQFPELSRSRITRLLKRLRLHGLLRKLGHTYTYYVTRLGQRVLIAVLHLKQKLFESRLTSQSAVA
jgi:hypothetical protein